jgi:3-oxoacyl-[acyl-carrier-protein] synthase II
MLDRAEADGDPIHAVIRAVGNAHNGRAGGLTGSDAGAQRQLLHSTARAAGIKVGDLGYLEAHGTGTPGGDQAEIEALVDALADDEDGRLWVGSIKASVGHLEAAAGLLGLVKTVLMIRHGLIPRIAGLAKIDPALRLGDRVGIAVEDVPWSSSRLRLAAVNSFGLGGTMSCAVVEEYRAPQVTTRPPGERRIPLGAGSEEALSLLATRLADAVEEDPAPDLADLAWTLRTARRTHPIRRVGAASDGVTLAAHLRELAAEPGSPGPDAEVGSWEGDAGRRIHLPGTPFTRRPYWFDGEAAAPVG